MFDATTGLQELWWTYAHGSIEDSYAAKLEIQRRDKQWWDCVLKYPGNPWPNDCKKRRRKH